MRKHLGIRRLRTNQPLTETGLKGLEQTLAEIGERVWRSNGDASEIQAHAS
ncbi:hypothetical protein IC757_13240 [Wenzhouxiangella sp. AB-CW3]|uniref:hypothetical protein n=1 Tax=Wenzhouxiangella sp. AB-CW3 TaxID=2771012 RepID=UPI00168BB0E3|nr:hypothetical protein [Wenzhouxiangella sp. AB-CW3]QOC21982.1 hypothetical protein IC757_13240 [Wenzhouxiangella sp. AB-CW3]